MRRALLLPSLIAALLLLSSCAGDAAEGPPPADFSLRYDWREGSLPPPYHYEYSITIAADGSGMMTMVPDYPGPGVPVWEELFIVTPDEMDRLHDLMIEQGLLRERWRAQDNPPVGGSYASLKVTRAGRTIEIPAFPPDGQRERAAAIFAAVEAVVPQSIRDDLERRRAEYEAANQ